VLSILLNQLTVTSARLVIPATGVWIAELDVDLDLSGILPIGKAILTIGTKVLAGTVDSRSSGVFGRKGKVFLVGGGGGWDKTVPAQHFHTDVGVMSTQVYSVTAALVGEVVTDTLPTLLGKDFVRTAGPASRVLSNVDWFVDFTGITVVGPRLPFPFNPLSVDILEWDPDTRRATLASDDLIVPGTLLVDTRFGTATVRDVEQTFTAAGARVIAWCEKNAPLPIPGLAPPQETPGHRLARAIGNAAREAINLPYLRRHKYRVVLQGGDRRLVLQSVKLTGDVPPILQQIEVWPGIPGISALVVPGTVVLVAFVDSVPVVVGFDKGAPTPLQLDLSAIKVNVGLGTSPAARSVELLAWAANVNTALASAGFPVAPLAPTVASTKLFTD
jgi:hypothetical protein